MVIFTDGKWNASRTLVSAPGYTNVIQCPTNWIGNAAKTNFWVTNSTAAAMTNGQYVGGPEGGGPWDTDVTQDGNLLPVPSMRLVENASTLPMVTNAINTSDQVVQGTYNDFSPIAYQHTNDAWQSGRYLGIRAA